ncbi:GCN5 family acetyltransferase [Methanosarcina sp. 1.H.T.1A.1]|uniref:GNAT family N-acetyltransferase n=1 Tax=Methanosarcina sp. 1.H.T.1A.1 TaxID=1483602 RepID=UPI00062251AB|nr:GNAT family N-acetyltransferase [Methanosarcina sp. 1.H.T.1A.1]KKH95996.1 GCN5 family acetyltransferase [Methanosarcina sp. 1.H.T.1A.1]
MDLAKIHAKPDLYLRGFKKTLWDTAGIFLLKGWKQIEKENVGTVDDAMLSEILRIQAEGFKNERQGEIIKYSQKFRKVFYVIKRQDKVIGYCIYHMKPFLSSRGFEKKSVIYSIAIDSKFRKKGFGRKLLEESIREMKLNRVFSVLLYVNVNNIPAIKLYEKTGFLIVKEVENVCGQKEICYKMELKLF